MWVRVVSRKKIWQAAARHGEWEASLAAWYKVAKNAEWRLFGEIKHTWKSVDRVDSYVSFDIDILHQPTSYGLSDPQAKGKVTAVACRTAQ